MKITVAKLPSVIAAAVLAVMTLAVFYILQDYGPASAIRRFHAALAKDDKAGELLVVDCPIGDPNLAFIINQIRPFVSRGIQPQVARMDRQPGSVRVAVVYTAQNHERYAIIWIVDKKGSLWKIDTKLTAAVLRNNLLQ